MSNLVPTVIYDRNGVRTTRKKRVESASAASIGRLSQISASPSPARLRSIESDTFPTSPSKVRKTRASAAAVENAQVFASMYPDLEIENRSTYVATKTGLITLTLDDMADGRLASNNCTSASEAVLRFASESDTPLGRDIELISAMTEDDRAEHQAVISYDLGDDDGVVVDYTCRQYNNELPFPWVGSTEEWFRMLRDHAELGDWQ